MQRAFVDPIRSGAGTASPQRRWWVRALALPLLGACASKPPAPPAPTVLALDVRADERLNLDARGRPSPLVVRVYELKSTVAFERADFLSLYNRDQATLGADLVSRDEFVIAPGATRTWGKEAGAETRAIGVLAAYRALETAQWRAIATVRAAQRNALTLQLLPAAVALS